MKRCLKCGRVYADADLNFCLDDGELLIREYPDASAGSLYDEPPTAIFAEPPTILSDPTRRTSPSGWPEPTRSQTNPLYSAPPLMSAPVMQHRAPDQTMATVSLVLGVLSIVLVCCYGGLWLGAPAAIVGYFALKRVASDPINYGGKSMANAGLVLGIISFVLTFLIFIAGLLAR